MKLRLIKRFSVIGLSTAYNLCLSAFSVLLSLLVIRLCSRELWGSMVEILLWLGITAHLIYWGNKDFLLRQFSMEPMNLQHHWLRNMHARIWLFVVALAVPFFLPISFKLKLILLLFLSARFLYQSYDVIVLYKKQFGISIILESVAFLLIAANVWLNHTTITLNRLCLAFAIAELVKACGIYLFFQKEFPLQTIAFSKDYFIAALPFFLLGFTGLLQSKADLICVTFFLPKDQIAQYQVYINFLLFVQASSAFILAPFAKNIYRLKKDSIMKISMRLFILGIVITAITIPLINFVITSYYHFSLPATALLSGALFIIPVFYYSPIVYYLLKLNGQSKVLLITTAGIIIAFILNVIMIPASANGISGAINAIAITQWVLLVVCIFTGRLYSPEPEKENLARSLT